MGSIRRGDSTSKRGRRQRRPWQVRYYDPNGELQTESFATQADAKQFEHQVELAKSRGTYTDPRGGRLTLAEWAEEWIGFHQVREATKKKNRLFLDRHILPELGRMPLTRIGERDYLRFVGTLADKGLSPASVRSITNTLTAVLNGAVSAGLLAPSPRPARLWLRLRLRNAAEAVILTHTEIRELIEEVPGRYQALVFLLAYAGLRWSEAAGLTRQRGPPAAAAERGRELHRRELRAGEEPSQRRTIALSSDTVSALAEHLRTYRADATEPGDLVFTGSRGGGLDDNVFRARVWRPAVARAGLADRAPTPHDLRHSHVAHLIAEGWHPLAISKRLGHTSIKTTLDLYGHLMDDHEDTGLDRLDAAAARVAERWPRAEVRSIERDGQACDLRLCGGRYWD